MAIQGNFKIGGRSFAAKQASSGGNKKKEKTGTSFGPAGMVGSDQRLQNLIDRKDEKYIDYDVSEKYFAV